MKKTWVLLCCALIALAPLGANQQKIHPIDSPIYDALSVLYMQSGYALPSTARPWSSDELATLLTRIDEQTLSPELMETYRWLLAEAAGVKKPYEFSLSLALEGYYHTNSDDFTKEELWIRGYNERKPVLDVSLETHLTDHFYGWASISIAGAKFSGYSEDAGPLTYLFGEQNLTTNIFFVTDPTGYQYLDFNVPYRIFGALGGRGWSAEIGYDRLSWGPGLSGNFMLDDHVKYHNVGRFTTYMQNFKFTLVTSFFPHPKHYYPIIDVDKGGIFDNEGMDYDGPSGINMFLGHRLEWRLFSNRVGFALSESIMYQSETDDSTLDLRVLNPAAIFHNYYIRGHANSLLTFELDYTPVRGINVYGVFALDEFAVPLAESIPGKDTTARPNAWAAALGARGAFVTKAGIVTAALEGVYTNPYLYLRDYRGTPKDGTGWLYDDWGITYVVAVRESYATGTLFDETFIGYPHGPDAIVLNARTALEQFGAWKVEGNLFYMWHGTRDKWTMWSLVSPKDTPGGIPPEQTPTATHTTGNYGDLTADGRDAVSRTFAVGVRGSYHISSRFALYGQVDYISIVNPKNRRSNPTVHDVQITVGCQYVW